MENKEEVIRAINIAIDYYTLFADAEYSVLIENNMQTGVCSFLKRKGFVWSIYNKIDEIGRLFLIDNYRDFKKEYKNCLKGYNRLSLYWSRFVPATSADEVTMRECLAIRLRILKAIKIKLEIL